MKNPENIQPYSISANLPMEFIFPITSRISLLVNHRRKENRQHSDVFSENAIRSINRKIALYADRYIFAESGSDLNFAAKIENRCPIAVYGTSTVGNGQVFHVGYEFGLPDRTKNTWRYNFHR